MVIGNGMIAKKFSSYLSNDDFIIFASGVSDSTHSPADAFTREKKMLTDTIQNNPGKTLVYFSSCSIYDPSLKYALYVKHKKEMEELIMEKYPRFIIFRLSNPVGRTGNTNTVVNFFIKNILEKHAFQVWTHASRNIIDIDHMYMVCHEILREKLFLNSIVNIANPHNYPVPFIVETIEKHFDRKAIYTMVNRGAGPHIDISQIEPLFRKLNINFDEEYLPNLLQKYFPVK